MPFDMAAVFAKDRPEGALSCYGWACQNVALFFDSKRELGITSAQYHEQLSSPERHTHMEMHIRRLVENLGALVPASRC